MRRSVIGALGLITLMVSCGGGEGPSEIEGQDVVVRLFDNRFEYTEVRIPTGGTVTWLGAGRNPHNAMAVDGSWSTETVFGSLEQLDGDAAVLTYDQPGTFPFFCTLHGNSEGAGMSGTLVVGGG
ncbi:MAG: plastocyanin/azurin family copper-binding protein [Acidimicrobiia bacterium]